MRYDAVMFDLDGTLVDSLHFHTRCFQRFLKSQGVALPFDAVQAYMGPPLEEIFPRALPGLALEDAFEAIDTFYRESIEDLLAGLRAVPGAPQLLERLAASGVSIAVVTNTRHLLVGPMLRAVGIETPALLLGAEQPPTTKGERCRRALENFRVRPERALYVGDVWGDAETALSAGMDSCLVDGPCAWAHGYKPQPGPPAVFVVEDFGGLEALLELDEAG